MIETTTREPSRRSLSLRLGLLLLVLGGGVLFASRPQTEPLAERQAAVQRQKTVLSDVYRVDKLYKSMMGPWSGQDVVLGEPESDELVWITGYRAVMVGADGETPMAQDFMCHSNLDVDFRRHQAKMGEIPGFGPRLFTLSQGQLEIDFPPGFGIPVRSDEALNLTTQVLNLNLVDQAVDVRHKVTVDFVRDAEVGPGMTPLMPSAAYGLALLEGEDGYYGVESPAMEKHGPGCLVGETASDHAYQDGHGRTFSGHWQVPPGRQENRTLVTHLMNVPYETTVHYIAVHLHPFAESLSLKNLTTGKTLFTSRARNFDDKIGLTHVDAFSSPEGIPVHPDHDYELISRYDNTTDQVQDSMAVMYIYLRDMVSEKRIKKQRRSR